MGRDTFHLFLILAMPLFSVCQFGIAQEAQPLTNSQTDATSSLSHPNTAFEASSTGPQRVPEGFANLRLAPGFTISVTVLDDSDFTGTYSIDEHGNLTLPILGTIHVGGETGSDVRLKIQRLLSSGEILKDPQVNLTVIGYTVPEVTIIGEVVAPGKYPLLLPNNLVGVLALAGGPTRLAGNEVLITRGNRDSMPVSVRYSKDTNPKTVDNVIVYPGDTIQIKRAGIIYVLGGVNRPGGYVMQEEGKLNVLQAVSLASGTSLAASTKSILLLRRNSDGTEVVITLPFKKIREGKRANVDLRSADILYVPTSAVKSVLTSTQSIVTAAGAAAVYKY